MDVLFGLVLALIVACLLAGLLVTASQEIVAGVVRLRTRLAHVRDRRHGHPDAGCTWRRGSSQPRR
jgi:hypothetical protein